MCKREKFYEAGTTPPPGVYVCAGCWKETVYISDGENEIRELPVCSRCHYNYWEKKISQAT